MAALRTFKVAALVRKLHKKRSKRMENNSSHTYGWKSLGGELMQSLSAIGENWNALLYISEWFFNVRKPARTGFGRQGTSASVV